MEAAMFTQENSTYTVAVLAALAITVVVAFITLGRAIVGLQVFYN